MTTERVKESPELKDVLQHNYGFLRNAYRTVVAILNTQHFCIQRFAFLQLRGSL